MFQATNVVLSQYSDQEIRISRVANYKSVGPSSNGLHCHHINTGIKPESICISNCNITA